MNYIGRLNDKLYRLILIISITTSLSLSANSLSLDFEKTPTDSTELKGISGKFRIITTEKENKVLEIYSKNKQDSSNVKILLKNPKKSVNKFKLTCDIKISTSSTPAGKLFAISDWNTNQELFRLETSAGRLQLKATNFVNG